MVNLNHYFSKISSVRVLLAGDFMLDKYTAGTVERISPEAPVPVLHVKNEEYKAGGAGNVAVNLLALNAEVKILGRIGDDFSGNFLKSLLQEKGADTQYFFKQKDYVTTVKNRLISDCQQIIRVDTEIKKSLTEELEEKILFLLPEILKETDIIAVSDYAKGFLSDKLLKNLIFSARERGIDVIVDPKGLDFTKYRNATLVKPNLNEAYLAANMANEASLNQVADRLVKIIKSQYLLITRSKDGISLFYQEQRKDFSVHSKEVIDVTGAGDTVLAMMTVCMGNQFPIEVAISFSNIAAGIAVEHIGCKDIRLLDIAEKMIGHKEQKIFKHEHFLLLKEILKEKDFSLLIFENQHSLSLKDHEMIKTLSDEKELLIFIQGEYDEKFICLLSSLKEVKSIILEISLEDCLTLKPNKVIYQDGKLLLKKLKKFDFVSQSKNT